MRDAAAGDAESREEFSRLYDPIVRSYLAARWRRSLEDEDVSDGVQEVLLQCFKEGGALGRVLDDRPGGFRAYLYGVARNVAATLEAARARRPVNDDGLDAVPSDEATLSRAFDRAFARALTREARRIMESRADRGENARHRARALALMYEEGLPAREVAARMGVDVAAVYIHLSRGRKEFREALVEALARHHPGESEAELERRCVEIFAAL